MHVLMTVNAAWNIWNFRLPLVRKLIADGHHVSVLSPSDGSVSDLEAVGCRVLPLSMSVKGLNPLADMKLRRALLNTFRLEQPDMVLSYTIKNNIFGAMAAEHACVPFLPNVTGLGTAFLSGRVLQAVTETLYRRAFSNLPVVFFQNSDDRDLFLERKMLEPSQARLLPGSGIDLDQFKPSPLPDRSQPKVFLMIARLLRDKGVLEFVEAARAVKSQNPEVRFQLLGAAGSQNRTAIGMEMVNSWVAEGVVEYLGTTQDVRPMIRQASCVVLPSYREGAPRTLIEAAAMARPIIATDVPGCRAVVDREVSGFVCDVKSAESLAASMERFLSLTPEQHHAMGAAGRRKMEREYDQRLVVDAYYDAIGELNRERR